MRTGKNTIHQNNRGLTLVEMIVTVAIIAIFSGVVVTAVGVGSNLYRNVSSSTRVQVDTQELLDEMEDLIIDANRSVYYAYGSSDSPGEAISGDIDGSGGGDKTFLVCNEYENGDGTSRYLVDALDWVEEDEAIYYSQRQYTAQSTEASEAENSEENVAAFSREDENAAVSVEPETCAKDVKAAKNVVSRSVYAEGIKNFRADVSQVVSDRIVRFQLTTENHGKKINTLHTVNLRNRIQVAAPDDAFLGGESTDVGIVIVGAPESVDAGKSVLLSYKLTGNGSIDPTTLHWTVENGDGSFPTDSDPTYGKLTALADGTETITVTVSAKTADGKTVVSAPVYIKINGSTKKTVSGIRGDVKEILVGAGNSVDLNSAVGFRAVYSDGSTGKDALAVSWKLSSGNGLASLGGDGQLSVGASAGQSNSGSFAVTATYTDEAGSFTGDVTVKVARIDLTAPENGRTYQVGDAKELACTYMEGGEKVDGVTAVITTLSKPDTAGNYQGADAFTAGNFEATDVGDWKVKASVDVTKRGGYGSVESESGFKVAKNTSEGGIVVNARDGADVATCGGSYTCGPAAWGQDFGLKVDVDFSANPKITWWVEGTGDIENKVSVEPSSDNHACKATVNVKPGATGFVLCAKYSDDKTEGETARYYISVVTGVKITGVPDEVEKGKEYPIGVIVTLSKIRKNGTGYENYEDTIYAKTGSYGDNAWGVSWKGDTNWYNFISVDKDDSTESGYKLKIAENPSKYEGQLDLEVRDMDAMIKQSNTTFTDTCTIKIRQ